MRVISMIIKYVKSKKKNNQGRIRKLIKYIFGKTKHTHDANGRELTHETIKFIGSSNSLPMTNPLLSFDNGVMTKISGKDASLTPLINTFLKVESLNARVMHPFEHIIVSLQEGEDLNIFQWRELVDDLLVKLGFDDHHWIALWHGNTLNNHCHIAVSTISNSPPHRRLVLGNSFKKIALIRNELEKKFGLKHDHNPYTDGHGKKVSDSKYKTKVQTIRSCIDKAIEQHGESIPLPIFIERLNNLGVGCFAQTRRDSIRGVSFSLGKYKITGSKLGIGYSWNSLQERGVYYDHSKHAISIENSNSLEQKVTRTIEAYSLPEQPTYNNKYLLVKKVKLKFKAHKQKSKYKAGYSWGLWIRPPMSFKGMNKQQIEQQISFLRMLRRLLWLYFNWLKKKDAEKQFAYELIKPYLWRIKEPTDGDFENTFSF